ncbi:hypothetical protein E2C01_085814 [Portunus trituberculatus]|uniref:Uncharacterized protein n=1 Tax=Portunus trituberculatus TaxID=210409 RepID=A0A5B7J3Q5_PORTR|nr:hypothetical protein [Portunus trituberculatus]
MRGLRGLVSVTVTVGWDAPCGDGVHMGKCTCQGHRCGHGVGVRCHARPAPPLPCASLMSGVLRLLPVARSCGAAGCACRRPGAAAINCHCVPQITRGGGGGGGATVVVMNRLALLVVVVIVRPQ